MKGILFKLFLCLKEKRVPGVFRIKKVIYWFRLILEEFFDRWSGRIKTIAVPSPGKFLYASPVGKEGKKYLEKIIQKFGYDHFDFMIFVYDDTLFEEPIFKKCHFVREKGLKWFFMKKYLTPVFSRKYSYLFIWDDDIAVDHFSYEQFIAIMQANHLELAQPALEGGNATHEITLKREKGVGRLVDFIEIMVPVFTQSAWIRGWYMIEPNTNFWGFGYDDLARSFCGYKRMGIVDAQAVIHTRPPQCISDKAKDLERNEDWLKLLQKYYFLQTALRISYSTLRRAVS